MVLSGGKNVNNYVVEDSMRCDKILSEKCVDSKSEVVVWKKYVHKNARINNGGLFLGENQTLPSLRHVKNEFNQEVLKLMNTFWKLRI